MNLQYKLEGIISQLRENGAGSRQSLEKTASELFKWREQENIQGLWSPPKTMVTGTLDDGLGHGLDIIHMFAEAVGLKIHKLGLLQPPEIIIETCTSLKPDFLGLTILQFDSEEALTQICNTVKPTTQVIVGGPIFKSDENLGKRAGVDYMANDVGDFLSFLIESKKFSENCP